MQRLIRLIHDYGCLALILAFAVGAFLLALGGRK